jgi:cytochrome c biogenesis protein CcdA
LGSWPGASRARRPATRAPKPRSTRGTGPAALVAAGALFALSAILDPTFVSLAVVAGRDGAFWSVVAAHSVWVLVSQAPLVVLLVAMAGGAHGRFVAWFRSWWEKVRPAVGRLITGAALLVGAFFLLDSGWWLATGEFLVTF